MKELRVHRQIIARWTRSGVAVLCLLSSAAYAADEPADNEPDSRGSVGARIVLDGAPLFDDTIYDDANHGHVAVDDAGVPVMDEQTALEISRQITQFEENIATLESEFGPYDASLIEGLMDQARYLSRIGQHQSAAIVYDRALSITRISNGLLSPDQLPVLDDLTAAHKAAGDWQKADDREHLIWHLQSRLHPPGSEAHAEALIAFGQWKMQVVRGNLLDRSLRANFEDLAYLQESYRSAVEEIIAQSAQPDADPAVSASVHFSLLHGKAQAEYQLADYLIRTLPSSIDRFVPRYVSVQVCDTVVDSNGQPSRVCHSQRVENPRFQEVEMQKRLYEDRIRSAMQAMRSSIDGMQAIVDSSQDVQVSEGMSAQQAMDEIANAYGDLNQNYRRNTLSW